ncbi:hypothetical protein [Streptomyces sp. NPDC058254]|uniref:hypothetical protein n=1 Tax=Streptomyces sp. NPDC058254 TaxID=3346406 RepID=UPI0036E4AA19
MPRFNITAKVTKRDGGTREVTGTIEHPSELFSPAKARNEAQRRIERRVEPGETVKHSDIEVREVRRNR